MKRYWAILGLVLLLLVCIFLLVEGLDLKLLTEPGDTMSSQSFGVAAIGVGLLAVDAILPVPASLVMIANGMLFGIWIGAFLSLMGSLGAAALAFEIGRRGTPLLERFLTAEERWQADKLIQRWGLLAIVITRPMPLLAETTLLVAGSSQMGWRSMFWATLIGSVPPALLYAFAGAKANGLSDNGWVYIGAFCLFALVVGIAYRHMRTRWRGAPLWTVKLRKI